MYQSACPVLLFLASIFLAACSNAPVSVSTPAREGYIDCDHAEREIQLLEGKLPDLPAPGVRSASSPELPPWMTPDSRALNDLRNRAFTIDQEQQTRRRIQELKNRCEVP